MTNSRHGVSTQPQRIANRKNNVSHPTTYRRKTGARRNVSTAAENIRPEGKSKHLKAALWCFDHCTIKSYITLRITARRELGMRFTSSCIVVLRPFVCVSFCYACLGLGHIPGCCSTLQETALREEESIAHVRAPAQGRACATFNELEWARSTSPV